jgi:hypothetical protein
MSELILLASYWNECDWIDLSLEQIERLDPAEVIVSDGCFDPRRPERSTDGTREKIEAFVRRRGDSARLVDAVRIGRAQASLAMLRGLGRGGLSLRLPRLIRALGQGPWRSLYRINQALTFGRMIQLSVKWLPGNWVMTSDADQFYSDELLEQLPEALNSEAVGLLTARELTFRDSLEECTEHYETRTWNNMPHRIYRNTVVYPTRHFCLEGRIHARRYPGNVASKDLGTYFHYKFRGGRRVQEGYGLGDREPPRPEQWEGFRRFRGEHPRVIRDHFEDVRRIASAMG